MSVPQGFLGWRAALGGAACLAANLVASVQSPCAGEPTWDVQVGVGGVYRTGAWTPLVVSRKSRPANPTRSSQSPDESSPDGGYLYAWVEDPDGQYVRSPPAALVTDGGGTQVARVCVRFGRPTGRVLIQEPGQKPTYHGVPPAIGSTETVLLVVGNVPNAERASRLLARDDGTRPRVVTALDPLALGKSARDFDGVDAIIICGQSLVDSEHAGGSGNAASSTPEDRRTTLTGIDSWVRQGGRLVFIAGECAPTLVDAQPAAAAWLPGPIGRPGEIARMVPLRRLTPIETYSRASRPFEKNAMSSLQVPLLANVSQLDGVIEAFAGNAPTDLPLVVRTAYGFGTITWIGIDIDQGAFRTWQGTDTLLVALLGGRPRTADSGRAGEMHSGVPDLAAQLRMGMDQFVGVQAVPFELIVGLAMLAIGCLYPLDWWLVSRWGSRQWLAWISLPLLVAILSSLAWITANRWKSDAWKMSRAEIIDIDATSRLVRASAWAGVWSPANASLDVDAMPTLWVAQPAVRDPSQAAECGLVDGSAQSAISWCADSGRRFGSTDAAMPHPSLATANYGYSASLASLAGVPIAASSSRLFESQWTARTAGSPATTSLDLNAQGTLRGGIAHHLPFPLTQCVLVHAGWLYEIGRLAPHQRYEPDAGRGPRSLTGALTRRAASRESDVALRWDTSSVDTARILEIAGFHAAVGGRGYTSLLSGRLERIDLSPLLRVDRAVLVGWGPAGTAWNTGWKESGCEVPSGESLGESEGHSLWRMVVAIGPATTEPLP